MPSRSIFIAVSLIAILCGCGFKHVSDATLIENFNRNEDTFNRLRDTALADADFQLISPRLVTARGVRPMSSDPPHAGMDPQRFAEYVRLFAALGLEDGILRSDQSVWFRVEAPSWRNGSVTKGYVYWPAEPAELGPLVPDLDSFVPQPTAESWRPRFFVLRVIKPNWYLYKLSDG
jgi:hypothetical protein